MRYSWLMIALAIITSCVSRKDGEILRDKLIDTQTRLAQLENREKVEVSKRQQGERRLAATGVDMGQVRQNIQEIYGRINQLEVGVIKGEVPGQTEESIAKKISDLRERMLRLEETQVEILKAIQPKKNKKNRPALTLKTMRINFNNKRYTYVLRDVEPLLKIVKKQSSKSAIKFYHAESLYKLGHLQKAALSFKELLNDKTYKTHAQMRMGDSFRHLGEKKAASIYYKKVLSSSPGSKEAKQAEKYLENM